ncbi:hypothetical protein [Streptomyces sp. NPDC002962]|uniref:hypothetical protein n=1 Tax=Streptomyces sp. NPDC002962 TaxID=3364674 RepID=UPI0036CACFB2
MLCGTAGTSEQERPDTRNELRALVWLSAGSFSRLRALAARVRLGGLGHILGA